MPVVVVGNLVHLIRWFNVVIRWFNVEMWWLIGGSVDALMLDLIIMPEWLDIEERHQSVCFQT